MAIAGSIALTHAKSLLRTGYAPAAASTAGYALGFWVIAGFAAAGVVVALLAIPSDASVEPAAAPVQARTRGYLRLRWADPRLVGVTK